MEYGRILAEHIFLIGLSHRTAPVELREKFSIPREQLAGALRQLSTLPRLREGLVLSTCNRLEAVTVWEGCQAAEQGIRDWLAAISGLNGQDLRPYLYAYRGEAAVSHFFRVTASLDSMVLGEPQILGQVKEAFAQAVECKTTGLVLNKLLHRSFFVAKRVRTETRIASHPVSVSFAAVELARKILGKLEDKRVLLIGAGEMSELAARHLIGQGVREILVTNRTQARAEELARDFGGRAVPFADFPRELKNVDIVLSSTGSTHYIIGPEILSEVIRARKQRPMFFIDIAVPRDIDPRVNEMPNVYLYDIDDLQGITQSNRGERQKELEKAEEIVRQGTAAFSGWLQSLEVVPTILDLREKMEKIRRRELEKALSLMKGLGEEEKKTLEALTRAIIKKILHPPIALLKHQDSRGQGQLYVEMTRKIFHLDEEEG